MGMKLLMATADVFPSRTRVDNSWGVFNIPEYIAPHPEAEVAVALEDCGRAMSELVELVHTKNIAVNYIVEVRGALYRIVLIFHRSKFS